MADIDGTADPDTLPGGAGADNIDCLDGSDLSHGNGGDDRINGGGGNDRLFGDGGDDTLVDDYNGSNSSPDNDTMDGGAGDDVLISYQALHFLDLDIMRGGAGNDNLVTYGAQTGDSVDGGIGVDTYGGDFGGSATIVLAFSSVGFVVQVDGINTASVANCERINFVTGYGNDIVTGGAIDDAIVSLGGADSLSGGAGDDLVGMITQAPLSGINLNGGAGQDTLQLYAGDGQNYLLNVVTRTYRQNGAAFGTITGFEALSVLAGNGNDTLVGGALSDDISGDPGNDSIRGGGSGDSLRGDEGDDSISAGAGNDTISLGSGMDSADGGAGNDRFFGDGSFFDLNAPHDKTIDAGAGNDTVGGAGDGSTVNGGTGTDTLELPGNRLTWSLQYVDGQILLHTFSDTIAFSGFESFQFDDGKFTARQLGVPVLVPGATAGADSLTGTANANLMRGLAGNDTLSAGLHNDVVLGGDGADSLSGGGGKDTIDGGAGRDTIAGGAGADHMSGGQHNDRFDFNALNDSDQYSFFPIDVIADFARGSDRIDLSTIDANAATAGNSAFRFIGENAFTALGQVRALHSGEDTLVELNAAGTTSADMVFKLTGHITLRAIDFVL